MPSAQRNELDPLVARVRTLFAPAGNTLESSGAAASLDEAGLKDALTLRVKAALSEIAPSKHADAECAPLIASQVLAHARKGLAKVAGDAWRRLSDREVSSLEAIIEVTGRPALRYRSARVEMPEELVGNSRWRVLVATERGAINHASRAVGRVSVARPSQSDRLIGTAWRFGKDLVVTNRHVLAELVQDRCLPRKSWTLNPNLTSFVGFDGEDNPGPGTRCRPMGIVFCAEEDEIDLAVLQLDRQTSPEAALAINWNDDALGSRISAKRGVAASLRGAEVYVVGHPYHQRSGQDRRLIKAIFQDADGSKRCSPGYITNLIASSCLFEHDCSTLGGNSGSCVVATANHGVVGLHFGARGVDTATKRGTANLAIAFARLRRHRFAEVLRQREGVGA